MPFDPNDLTPEQQQLLASKIPGLMAPPGMPPGAPPQLQDRLAQATQQAPPMPPPNQAMMPSAPGTLAPAGMSAPAPAPGTGIGTKLAQMGGPPKAPVMNPGFGQASEAVRADSSPIAKNDPQYRMGVGGRVLHGAGAFLSGGIPGLIDSAVNPNDPNYIGKGAVNSQYSRDEAARQARLAGNQGKVASFQDEYGQAEKGYKNELTGYSDEVKANAAQDVDAIRTKGEADRTAYQKTESENRDRIADLKQKVADAKDPAAKLNAESKARFEIGKQAGLKGKDLQSYGLVKDWKPNDPLKARELDLKEQEIRLAKAKLAKENAGLGGMNANQSRELKTRTSAIDEKLAAKKQSLTESDLLRDPVMAASVSKEIDDLQNQKNAITDEILNRAPGGKPGTPSAPAAQGPQKQPKFNSGSSVNFNGKPQQVMEVRRNSKTGEHSYNIGGQWYKDSELR